MGLFLREKNDGRRALGYGAYLLAGLGAALVVAVLHRRFAEERTPSVSPRPARESRVLPITQPAAEVVDVDVPAGPDDGAAPRYRISAPADRGGKRRARASAWDPFDAIEAVLGKSGAAEPSQTNALAGEPGRSKGPRYPLLPPALSGVSSQSGSGAKNSGDRLMGYRDPNADFSDDESARAPEAETAVEPQPSKVPRGSLIEVVLLTRVDTGNPAAVIQFGASRDLVFDHRIQIPFGTRFLGRFSGEAMRDRINLSADTIVYPDGTEVPISASAVEASDDATDLRPGLTAIYLPASPWSQAAPYATELFSGAMGVLAARAQSPYSIGLGAYGVPAAPGDAALRTALYDSSVRAVQDLAGARIKEYERRHGAVHIVPAGSQCWLQLDADLDLGPRSPGGQPGE